MRFPKSGWPSIDPTWFRPSQNSCSLISSIFELMNEACRQVRLC